MIKQVFASSVLLFALVAQWLAPNAVNAANADTTVASMVEAILARPLFEVSRRPFAAEPEPPASAIAAVTPPPPVFDGRLAGAIGSGAQPIAMFVMSDGNYVAAALGDVIDGWRLDTVTVDQVLLVQRDVSLVLEVEEREGAGSAMASPQTIASSRAPSPSPTATAQAQLPASTQTKFKGLGNVGSADLNAAFAGLGLGQIPESGASFRGRRVNGGRSALVGGFAPRPESQTISRFDGAGGSAAISTTIPATNPATNGLGAFADLAPGSGGDSFFSSEPTTSSDDAVPDSVGELAELLNFPSQTSGFRGRFVTKVVSLRKGDPQ